MSDYITGLRGDLVDAADRHRRRGRVGRATRQMPARTWRPALAAATIVTGAVAVLVAANALSPSQPVRPGIAALVQIGGQPQDAVAAGGSLWVTDFEGAVIRVDPETRRVIARIDVEGNPAGIAAGAGGVWVASPDTTPNGSLLSRIDPRSGRVVERVEVSGYVQAVAVGAGGVWLIDWHRPRLERIDAVSHEVTARVAFPTAGSLAARDDALWALGDEGTVVAVDGNSLATRRLGRVVGQPSDPVQNTLAADVDGAWVSDPSAGTVLRIHAGQVVSRTSVGDGAGPVAVGDGSVWAASRDPLAVNAPLRLSRIDPETETVTTTLDLGRRQAKALVTVGDDVWVIANDGTALLVENRASTD